MQKDFSKYGELAFGKQTTTPVTVKYEAQQHALDFIWSVLGSEQSIGLIHGPDGSGKSTIIRQLMKELPHDTAVAIVDGTRLKPRSLLSAVLAGYGYSPDLESSEELLQMVRVFGGQQSRSFQPPILVIENVDRMFPSALSTLGKLAALAEQGRPVLRIVTTAHKPLSAPLDIQDDDSGVRRTLKTLQVAPMSANETLIYLHARLEACGMHQPDSLFPGDVCDKLHRQSGGWPGQLNQHALATIAGSKALADAAPAAKAKVSKRSRPAGATTRQPPVLRKSEEPAPRPSQEQSVTPPRLIISKNGKTIANYEFSDKKVLVGRSEFADIVLSDEFTSKFHTMFLLYSDGLVLIDLNSVNGTYVNSVKVKSTLLLENDIVSLGHHRLKIENAPVEDGLSARRATMADTAKMKSLDEMRQKRRAQLKAV